MTPMPGDFFPAPPKLDLSGPRSQFFRSPQTPSAASSLCRSITSHGSRKRAKYSYNSGLDDRITSPEDYSTYPASPVLLANTDYCLRDGGIETPTLTSSSGATLVYNEQYGNGPEADYRPNRYQSATSPSDGNKRKREHPSPSRNDVNGNNSSGGWGRAMISLVGGVAGRVWDFCWSGPFRGFYAGGGRGYDIKTTPTTPSLDQSSWQKLPLQSDSIYASSTADFQSEKSPLPGRYPTEHSDELLGNWVVVRNQENSRENSPPHATRKIPRRSSIVRHVGSRKPALRPIPKRPNLTPTRPASYPNQNQQEQSPLNHKTASTSPKRGSSPAKSKDSPVATEAQRYAAKIRRREREEDASIRRLNQQLKAMIREGKEALGTKIEVEMMDVDYDIE